jgi:hypothetical protein
MMLRFRLAVLLVPLGQWSFFTVNTTEFLDDLAVRDHRFAKALHEVDASSANAGLH